MWGEHVNSSHKDLHSQALNCILFPIIVKKAHIPLVEVKWRYCMSLSIYFLPHSHVAPINDDCPQLQVSRLIC